MNNIDHRDSRIAKSKFHLDRQDGKIAGVCAGLARHFGIDLLIVRGIFLIGAIAGFGSFILIYLLIWLLAD